MKGARVQTRQDAHMLGMLLRFRSRILRKPGPARNVSEVQDRSPAMQDSCGLRMDFNSVDSRVQYDIQSLRDQRNTDEGRASHGRLARADRWYVVPSVVFSPFAYDLEPSTRTRCNLGTTDASARRVIVLVGTPETLFARPGSSGTRVSRPSFCPRCPSLPLFRRLPSPCTQVGVQDPLRLSPLDCRHLPGAPLRLIRRSMATMTLRQIPPHHLQRQTSWLRAMSSTPRHDLRLGHLTCALPSHRGILRLPPCRT
jgi:hypothetical protein